MGKEWGREERKKKGTEGKSQGREGWEERKREVVEQEWKEEVCRRQKKEDRWTILRRSKQPQTHALSFSRSGISFTARSLLVVTSMAE